MASNQYLLEVGTEELPVGFLLPAIAELKEKAAHLLTGQGLGFGEVTVYATPRRLTLVIRDIAETQEDREDVQKGPPVRVGLDAEGKPSKAGEGFARKLGINFNQLTRETIEGEEYLVLRQHVKGRPTKEILSEQLGELILGLTGSHFMNWGTNTIRFSRPIRWLVSLWNEEHLPLGIGPVQSGVVSRGHRIIGEGEVQIPSVEDYLTVLERHGAVLADQARRKAVIWQQLQDAAQKAGGIVEENEDLLDTVTMLVEHPSVVTGNFQERFLEIPAEVTTTVMTAHQKYFPIRQGEKLMPHFLTVSNGLPEAADNIRRGNEKVITARLEDARFFYIEDQKIPLEGRLEALKGITFQKGIGTMFEKAHRLETLSAQIAAEVGADDALSRRAARLAKTDLVTGMVFEFTELQGVMGKKYATVGGEPAEVCEAIYEHYLPRFMGDTVAKTPVGISVSLADKLDTMMAVFSKEGAKLPSGSKDPLGLRRMATGMILTALENELSVDLVKMLEAAYDGLGAYATQPREQAMALVNEFILQRLRGVLLERNIRYDIIDAVLEAKNPLHNLPDAMARIQHLKTLTQDKDALKCVYEPANRIFKILGDKYRADVTVERIDPAQFRHDSEKALLEAIRNTLQVTPGQYDELVQKFSALTNPVETFFEAVLVNDPDDGIRKNRYNLLSLLNTQYLRLASFSRLVV